MNYDCAAAFALATSLVASRSRIAREVANAVVFLASPAASVIMGAILTADGGAIA